MAGNQREMVLYNWALDRNDDATDNFYALLGVQPSASLAEITANYRRLALQWHPDRAGAQGERNFQRLNAAYAVLSNARLRAMYDNFGHHGLQLLTITEQAPEGSFMQKIGTKVDFFLEPENQRSPLVRTIRLVELGLSILFTGVSCAIRSCATRFQGWLCLQWENQLRPFFARLTSGGGPSTSTAAGSSSSSSSTDHGRKNNDTIASIEIVTVEQFRRMRGISSENAPRFCTCHGAQLSFICLKCSGKETICCTRNCKH